MNKIDAIVQEYLKISYTMLEKLTELRAHLEHCRNLLDELSLSRDLPAESRCKIEDIRKDFRFPIINTMKAMIAYKTAHGIEMTGAPVKPADPIKEVVECPGDAEIVAEILQEEKPERRREPVQYHPDPRMNKIMKAYCEMGGFSLDKVIKPFNIEKPTIEICDILEFVNKLKELRENNNISPTCAVYGHLCENSSIYVGIAYTEFKGRKFSNLYDAIMGRLHEHRNWPSSIIKANWTAVNKVVSPLFYFPGDKEDENLLTMLFYHCVGTNKVRGGDYTFIGPIKFPQSIIEEIKQKLLARSEAEYK